MRGLQHGFARLGVVGIVRACLHVDRRQLPLLQRVLQAFGEALFLLGLVNPQPVLQQHDAIVDQQLLEHRRLLQESLVLRVGAEAHHFFHAGTVVPAAVHQQDFAGGRQVRHITLEIPLRAFAVAGLWQGQDMAVAWIEELGDGVDHAALAGSVAALDHHQ